MSKILLIEDSPDIRALVRLLLEQGGHSVVEGADGEEGLALARAGTFDLILTDLAMPGLSGWDFVRLLKADPATAPTPVVALTAHAMRGDRERALALGCDGFIPKPIDDESFERTIRRHLPAAAMAAPTPPPTTHAPAPAPAPAVDRAAAATGRRVLVVDDNPGVCSLVSHLLSAAGFEVRSAVDGNRAMEEVLRDPPELVVLDVRLPGMDGYEVTRRIKARTGSAFLPIVLVTAGTVDRDLGLRVGADDFLGKPIDRVELLTRVRSLLRLRDAIEEGRRQNEALRETERTKERFIATVAHDLRTPLNAMGLTIDYLRELPPEPDELAELLGVLRQNIGQMNDLLEGLLDYSRLVAGKLDLKLASFAPGSLAVEVRDTLAATAAHRGLELDLLLDPGLPGAVVSDYGKCRQVVFNLASNALKFTDKGGVTLRARPEGAAGWAIQVEDTGVGIPQEDIGRIFEEFAQARTGRPEGVPGTGLGLAISRLLMDRLGGNLTVASEVGRGSRFTATWPGRVGPGRDDAQDGPDEAADGV